MAFPPQSDSPDQVGAAPFDKAARPPTRKGVKSMARKGHRKSKRGHKRG